MITASRIAVAAALLSLSACGHTAASTATSRTPAAVAPMPTAPVRPDTGKEPGAETLGPPEMSAQEVLIGLQKRISILCPMWNPCTRPAALERPLPASVSVDGANLSDLNVTSGACAAMAWAMTRHQPITWVTAYQRGSAYAVLQRLVYEKAQREGTVVSEDAARRYAEQQLATYLHDPNRLPLAPGVSAEDVFTSPSQVAGYRESLTVEAEKRVIAASGGGPAATPEAQSGVLLQWFATELKSHRVSVTGLPPFDPGTVLPVGTL